GFVPTMGALHEGHLSLVDLAARHADRVAVSLFVNPAQFAPGEDFDAYPRTEAEDAEKLSRRPADLLFAPNGREMYPPGFATSVQVDGPAQGLETGIRPHFFNGVATVVTKLLVQCAPDVAVFGEKDYQQLLVVRRLVRDLDLPVEIIGGPTVREGDGLALSSRNAYLGAEERRIAGQFNRVLKDVARRAADGMAVDEAVARGKRALLEAGFEEVQYLEVRDAETLEPLSRLERPARVLGAVKLPSTRLIDNVAVGGD
ncbi:MAG: pantoate--beta-alanine ligase, partial [Alphaproteobacteria bacterium]